ncbi:MAG: hypothetical protein QNJ54_16640 [Prochloraceae cyanobacterium]|nr:hypothetical protein [Prochloraceae cyanobacterium]
MNSKDTEKFQIEYQAGKEAFERGQYRLSVQHLETASKLIAGASRKGGEAQMWLVTAYQALGKQKEAIALTQKLCHHPHREIRQQSQRLLYIYEAPKLSRPKEWMTEIPDLSDLSDRQMKDNLGISMSKSNSKENPAVRSEDLTQINTKDNQFIWVALLAIILVLGSLVWFGSGV